MRYLSLLTTGLILLTAQHALAGECQSLTFSGGNVVYTCNIDSAGATDTAIVTPGAPPLQPDDEDVALEGEICTESGEIACTNSIPPNCITIPKCAEGLACVQGEDYYVCAKDDTPADTEDGTMPAAPVEETDPATTPTDGNLAEGEPCDNATLYICQTGLMCDDISKVCVVDEEAMPAEPVAGTDIEGCVADTDCAMGESCDMATGQCIVSEEDMPVEESTEETPLAEEEPVDEEQPIDTASADPECNTTIDNIYIPQIFLLDNNPGGVGEEDGVNISLSFLRDPDSMQASIEAHLAGIKSSTVYCDGDIASSGDPVDPTGQNMTAAQTGTPPGAVVKVTHGDAEVYVTVTNIDGAGHEENIDLLQHAAQTIGTFEPGGTCGVTGVLGETNTIDGAGSVSIAPAITVTYCPELTKQVIEQMKTNQAFGCNGDNGTPDMNTLSCVYQ